jgi:hypothetical protein
MSNTQNTQVFLKLTGHLRQAVAPDKRLLPITLQTEVYHNLGIYGDDLFDLLLWINKEFGVTLDLNIGDYGPTEWPFLRIRKLLSKFFGGPETAYKSLKVGDVVAAVEAYHCPS